MFFIEPNRLVEDEENLFLSLKLAEGKGFSDEAIHSLLKKEYHIPVGFLELKEQLRYIMVFHSLFNRMGRVTKEIKKVIDTISKRERLIGILFNKDLLAGARIIVVLDNWLNLLLEECKSTKSPFNCSLYFLTNYIIS